MVIYFERMGLHVDVPIWHHGLGSMLHHSRMHKAFPQKWANFCKSLRKAINAKQREKGSVGLRTCASVRSIRPLCRTDLRLERRLQRFRL